VFAFVVPLENWSNWSVLAGFRARFGNETYHSPNVIDSLMPIVNFAYECKDVRRSAIKRSRESRIPCYDSVSLTFKVRRLIAIELLH